MKETIQNIKTGNFNTVYLFYGAENYLINHYKNLAEEKANGKDMMNCHEFHGKTADVKAIYDLAVTLPFMANRRFITVKNSGLFAAGRKNDSEFTQNFLKEIPETTVLIFMESDVDKRSALYKNVAKNHHAAEFKSPCEAELIKWVINIFNKHNIKIEKSAAAYLLKNVSGSMDLIMSEAGKLIDYADGEITESDIDAVCQKSLDSRIFELVGAIGFKKPQKALEVYNNLMLLKESPIMVLSMIARQMRIILQVKEMSNLPADVISKEVGVPPFAISGALKQSGNFTRADLTCALKDCLSTDRAIKTGAVGDKTGVEMLILKFCKQ